MKTFIYIKTEKRATYGTNVILSVYHLKNNKPNYVGDVKYNTQSYRGENHEVANLLVDKKLINRNSIDKGGYINYKAFDGNYKLIQL